MMTKKKHGVQPGDHASYVSLCETLGKTVFLQCPIPGTLICMQASACKLIDPDLVMVLWSVLCMGVQ